MSESSSAVKSSVRRCVNCSHRMASLEHDPHKICVSCRGKNCSMTDRCDYCAKWTDETMKNYLSHQKALQRKREYKKRSKSNVDPLLSVCDGGG